MRTGIFGGTFNPPHIGHVRALKSAAEQLGLEKVLVIPSGTPPHKKLPAGSPDEQERFEMARLAFRYIENADVLDIELGRNDPCYSWQTIERLKALAPEDELWLLMGGDMFLSLPTWRRAEYIMRSVKIGAFSRLGEQDEELRAFALKLREEYGCVSEIIHNDPVEISSTQVRAIFARGENCPFIDRKVMDYIKKKGLYGKMNYDFKAFEEYDREHLSPKRLRHVLGCAEEAVRLAERWGADEDDARAAGLLHDVTKELGLEEQLKLCDKYGIILDNVERTAPKLLHSKTGAAIAKYEFGVPDRVADAIYWHTTGKADMNLLEKVLFMADYIEPTRDFEGVKELRRLAYEDLEGSMMLGLEITAQEVRERGQTLHVKSVEAMDWLREREGK